MTIELGVSSKSTRCEPKLVRAYRFKVENMGRRAATNVSGTLTLDNSDRRVCWYEGNEPTITINANDWSYLDVYGVVLRAGGPTGADRVPENGIVIPTEHGWDDLPPPRNVTERLTVTIRVTSANAKGASLAFAIDPSQECRPVRS